MARRRGLRHDWRSEVPPLFSGDGVASSVTDHFSGWGGAEVPFSRMVGRIVLHGPRYLFLGWSAELCYTGPRYLFLGWPAGLCYTGRGTFFSDARANCVT